LVSTGPWAARGGRLRRRGVRGSCSVIGALLWGRCSGSRCGRRMT